MLYFLALILIFTDSIFASAASIKYEFLGTMAGDQKSVRSNIHGTPTYTRVYTTFGDSNALRAGLNYGEPGISNLEDDYSYTPWGAGGFNPIPGRLQGGGFFKRITTLEGKAATWTSHQYALSCMKDQLEMLSGLTIQQIQNQSLAYGMPYIISEYFQCVEGPREGDLVLYENQDHELSAIYKDSISNWNSPEGGTVLVKEYWLSAKVTQRDFFFLPTYYGNHASFYRPRTAKLPDQVFPDTPSMGKFNGETFTFEETKENLQVRAQITQLFGYTVLSKFPEIRRVDSIKFIGVCSNYAFGKIAGTYSTPYGVNCDCHHHMFKTIVQPHFSITTTPIKGDLVVYFSLDAFYEIPVHWGVYMGSNYVESKWGKGYVYQHPVFYVDEGYGKYVQFYRQHSTPPGWPILASSHATAQTETASSSTSSR